MNYEIVKRNYIQGLWSLQMLKMAYQKGVITLEQYKEIKQEKESLENS